MSSNKTDDLEVVYFPLNELIPYVNNSRTHSEAQVVQIASSIKEFGFTNPLLLDEENGIIAGHGRLMGAKKLGLEEVPCIILSGLTTAQKKAYVIADNQLALNADWDLKLLKLEVEELDDLNFDIDLMGFDDSFITDLMDYSETKGLVDDDNLPTVEGEPLTKTGDVWCLGNHRVMCGDSTIYEDVEKLMGGKKAMLIHADPPYGMGKEGDGVANDNLYKDKLDDFQMDWWNVFRQFLEENGSAYIWGNAPDLWRFWYNKLVKTEKLTIRNEIVWDKKSGQGIGSALFRSFPPVSERCLFFMVGEQGFNNNADNYWEGWNGLREYLYSEVGKLKKLKKWSLEDVGSFLGVSGRMIGHWITKSQWEFIGEYYYNRLKKEANGKAFLKKYSEINNEFLELKKEFNGEKTSFYSSRCFFDNAHENMTDVWEYKRVSGEERHEHATPKPVAMMVRVMNSSMPPSGLCVEPFGGSGSTLIGAEKSGRKCYTMELQPFYCDIIVKRWQEFTGKDAILLSNKKTYSEIELESNNA